MFVIKKKQIMFFSLVVAVIVAFIFCFSSLTSSASGIVTGITVVLDAGHGGIDGGVTGVKTGIKESDLNLSVTRKLEKCLTDAGINVVLTRKTEGGLYSIAVGSFKKRDMKKRKEIIEKAKPNLVVSIHMNKFPISTRRGAQVFYRNTCESGKNLAQKVQTELNNMEEATRSYSALKGDYYILNCTDYSSIIVECGFLSNIEDEALLSDEVYQEKLAYTLFKGIISYLSATTSYGFNE
jgi:N-acetylmuramoyl-L-alanine amidase